ncbi:MAG: ferritin-like domain-containing protein [Phycisphaerae bacterium]|jgi:hypothetical protein
MALEYHEPRELLPEDVIKQHRAISSLIEELEAITWYNQRAAAEKEPALKKIVEHNRDEEIEHACMLFEWLRRNFPRFDENMKTYLFSEGDITELEDQQDSGSKKDNSLGIGKNKGI